MFDRLDDMLIHYEELMLMLGDPAVTQDTKRFTRLMKEQADLAPIVEAYKQYKQAKQDAEDSLALLEEESDEEMRELAKEELSDAKKRIEELENIGQIIRSRQAKLRKDIGLIDDILADGKISEAHLRMLIERIYVYETGGGLSLEIKVKAPFQNHTDSYENGVLTNSEIEELIGVS